MSTLGDEGRARDYYDAFSARYDDGRDRGYHALVDALELEAVRPFAEGARVLEIGCGTGLVLAGLERVARDAVGVDLSRGMATRARARGLQVVLGSATALPFHDGAFDVVCSFKVLPHVREIDRALEEAIRVTKPGGVLALEFYNSASLRWLGRLARGARRTSATHTEADVFTRWDSTRSVERRLRAAGAELLAFRGVRVVTPAAFVSDLPVVGASLASLERRLLASPFARFGGFLIALARRR